MASTPIAGTTAVLDIFLVVGGATIDLHMSVIRFEWIAMMNGGYYVTVRAADANYNILNKLRADSGYLQTARSNVVMLRFRLRWLDLETPNQTEFQIAHVIVARSVDCHADEGNIEFVAIDPPSWYLHRGNASGKMYKGRVSDAISQCVQEYAPAVSLDITTTTDSNQNRFYMMRQDPKTFISSLLDWSSPLTPRKGQWVVDMDGNDLRIKEQLAIDSNNVAFYRGRPRAGLGTQVMDWEMQQEDVLSILQTKLVTAGISATTGAYFDRITDDQEKQVFAKDSNIDGKYKASVDQNKAFSKPSDDVGVGKSAPPPHVGWTAIKSIPEVYSAGDVGKTLDLYIDGRARQLYLNMLNLIMRVCFKVTGHGIYSDSKGLGTNTITIEWLDEDGNQFLLHGNWIVYGYRHVWRAGSWVTFVSAARIDWNASGSAVP